MTAGVLAAHPGLQHGAWFDAGCGDGKGLAPLAGRLEGTLTGADRSVWGLRLAREQAEPVRDRLLRADARAWPIADGAFDVVRAVHLLGHLCEEDRGVAVREAARLLRPGGWLLVAEFGTGDFRCGTGTVVEENSFRRGHGIVTHYFTRDELHSLVEGAGLGATSCEAERFTVGYGGVARPRERWELVARKAQPGV